MTVVAPMRAPPWPDYAHMRCLIAMNRLGVVYEADARGNRERTLRGVRGIGRSCGSLAAV